MNEEPCILYIYNIYYYKYYYIYIYITVPESSLFHPAPCTTAQASINEKMSEFSACLKAARAVIWWDGYSNSVVDIPPAPQVWITSNLQH